MTSGHRLTEQQCHRIGRLAAERDCDGNWLLSYRQIAKEVDCSRDAVQDLARHCLIKWLDHVAWKDDPPTRTY